MFYQGGGEENMIRVLLTSAFGSMQGGGQRSIYLLIKHLNRKRIDPCLLVPEDGELAEKVRLLKVPVFICGLHRLRGNPVMSARSLKLFLDIVKANRIDIVHVESPRDFFYAAAVAKAAGVKVFYHARASDSCGFIDRLIYRYSDRIIAVSNAAARRFIKHDSKNKVEVVYNAVDTDEYSFSCIQKRSRLSLGYFGRIHPRKGLETLIASASCLRDKVTLLIMGDGQAEYLERLKRSASDNVKFEAYKADAAAEMKNVDVVVLPAVLNEGLSRMIIESMALGRIVVVSDVSSNVEAMGGELKEFIFPAGETESLTEILKGLTEDTDRLPVLGEKFRKRALDRFDVRIKTGEIERLYEKSIADKSA